MADGEKQRQQAREQVRGGHGQGQAQDQAQDGGHVHEGLRPQATAQDRPQGRSDDGAWKKQKHRDHPDAAQQDLGSPWDVVRHCPPLWRLARANLVSAKSQ